MKRKNEFIKSAGGCIISNNILNKKGTLKWCFREEPCNPADSGWRFLSNIDTEDFINDPRNLSVCDFNTMATIEPAVIAIHLKDIGSDFEFVSLNGKKSFINTDTGMEVEP